MNGEGRPDIGRHTWADRLRQWADHTGTEILGWILVPLGIVLMPAPGPGTLVLVGGIALLSRHHSWARRIRDPLQRRAIEAAKYGVATLPRIAVSVLGGVWLFALGVVWIIGPAIPEFEILDVGFGPALPAQGWATGLGLIASACAAWGLLAYSIVRWHHPEPD
ncbi:MAG: PGPGW domain-containing protein [Aeromicrobium sp.]|uniref:PGPGW domain-containing protein n=1 Tax=Aeromicrobium sp. TaxID=1871063 RepID=UPI0039E5B5DE